MFGQGFYRYLFFPPNNLVFTSCVSGTGNIFSSFRLSMCVSVRLRSAAELLDLKF